ncbi:MAG: hypothetical protein EOP93_10625 [Lysobacteraceae bacterium]|nr:MAG: hypothetical protein EOP93_10625 [Xanthomonadaceae bacterium]
MRNTVLLAIPPLLGALLCACSPPKPPEEDRRPEPQAQQASALARPDAYKDSARSAATASQDAAQRERAQLDAATR